MKAMRVILRVVLLALIVFAVYAFSTAQANKTWDVEYPMTNQNIEWRG